MKTLQCEMHDECKAPVTHIDEKGWVYCTEHGEARRSICHCRKLRPHELRRLERGEQVKRY